MPTFTISYNDDLPSHTTRSHGIIINCALAWSAIAEEHLAQRFIYVCVLCVTCVALGVEPRMTICADERSQFLLFVYLHPETQFLNAFNGNESV